MGYQLPIFKQYVSSKNNEVHVMHWDHKKLTVFEPSFLEKVFYYKRSEYNLFQLKNFISELNPNIIFVSGWMDKDYLKAIRIYKKNGIPIVTGIDNIWSNSIKQKMASLLFPWIKNLFFTHAWVAGPYQYEFAKKIGFNSNNIIHNCYSADLNLFNSVFKESIESKEKKYPHKFLFVGRLEEIKGVDMLINAWENINAKDEAKDWQLTLIGDGSLKGLISKFKNVEHINFLQPEELTVEIKKYGCFVLPSRNEPWGLVLHEFAAAGFPIICSKNCGAVPMFVINNFNGYTFTPNNIEDLENQMLKIINSSDEELLKKSLFSHTMGQRITPEISAANFLSLTTFKV